VLIIGYLSISVTGVTHIVTDRELGTPKPPEALLHHPDWPADRPQGIA
jgi:hypothetical protein